MNKDLKKGISNKKSLSPISNNNKKQTNQKNEINIYTDAGRLSRPLYYIDNNKTLDD